MIAHKEGEYTHQILDEFEELWTSQLSIPYIEFIENYTEVYNRRKQLQKEIEINLNTPPLFKGRYRHF